MASQERYSMSYGSFKRPRYEGYPAQYQDASYQPGYGPPAGFMNTQGPPPGHMGGPMSAPMAAHSTVVGPPLGINSGNHLAPPLGDGSLSVVHGVPPHDHHRQVPMGLGTTQDGSMPVVKLRGLPFDTSVEEVNRFLDCETVDVVLMKRGGRFSGEAYVVLPGMNQMDYALGKDRHYIGKRYVEVKPSIREDYYRAVANWIDDPDPAGGYPCSTPPSTPAMSRYGPVPRGRRMPPAAVGSMFPGPLPATGIVRLRGLPFTASQEEVAAWFNEQEGLSKNVDPADVHMVVAYDGRPTGSAFVEFSGPAEAEVAMGRNKAMMGSRYVELFHSSKSELDLALEGS